MSQTIGHRRSRQVPSDRGTATAEAAVVLPVLLVVLAMAVWVLTCVFAQLRCTDAAGLAARAAARGEGQAEVVEAALAAAPASASVTVTRTQELVQVQVRANVRPFTRALAALPAVPVSGHAVAAREDRVGAP